LKVALYIALLKKPLIMNTIQKMNKLAVILLILLTISWTTYNYETSTTDDISSTEKKEPRNLVMVNDDLYNLEIELITSENNKHVLVISIELNKSSHLISNQNKRDIKGKFSMDLANYANLNFNNNACGKTQSVKKFYPHPFVDESINWKYENKVYTQSLNLLSKNDFEVVGTLKFKLEHLGTLEKIPFVLSYKNGSLIITSPMC